MRATVSSRSSFNKKANIPETMSDARTHIRLLQATENAKLLNSIFDILEHMCEWLLFHNTEIPHVRQI